MQVEATKGDMVMEQIFFHNQNVSFRSYIGLDDPFVFPPSVPEVQK